MVEASRDERGPEAPIDPLHAHLVRSVDLTSLEATDGPDRIRTLCSRSLAPVAGAAPVQDLAPVDRGASAAVDLRVAAVCVHLDLVGVAAEALGRRGRRAVRVAGVAGGFPHGRIPTALAVAEVEAAVRRGADEIDVVIDRAAVLERRDDDASSRLRALRIAASDRTLKVILETGELVDRAVVEWAGALAVDCGADMLKTSTGKGTCRGATDDAVGWLAAVAAAADRPVGVKVSGGVRTWEDAARYLRIVAYAFGVDPLDCGPERFRIGASSLLDAAWPG